MTFDRRRQIALIIFAVAVAARLGFIAMLGVFQSPDSSEYQLLARNLLRFHAFSTSVGPPAQPAICRPPVYPLFLALLMPAGRSAILPAVAQAVLDALLCAMLFLMASRVARHPFAVAVSLLYAFHPGTIFASATVLTEVLFGALLFAAVFLTVIAAERPSVMLALGAGALFGVATLCRSIGVLYLLSVAFVLVVRRYRRAALALVIGAVVIVAPWVVRSSRAAGRFVFIQAPSVLPFYVPTLWWLDQNDEPAVWRYFAADPYGIHLSAAKTPRAVMSAEDFGRRQAIANVRKNAGGFLESRVRAWPHLFLNTFDHFTRINRSLGAVARAHDWPALAVKLGLMLLFTALPMAAACLGLAASRRTLIASLAAAIWIVTLAVHIVMWVEYRYWLPVVPFQFVSASLGIQRLLDTTFLSSRRSRCTSVSSAGTLVRQARD